MEKKLYTSTALECKEEGDQGIVQAVFATLNVVDSDGDVTLPGAFGVQKAKLGAWGHNWGDLPPGRGEISEDGNKAIFTGRFFLDTESGLQHFRTVKNLAELQEWSYGFRVEESSSGDFEGQNVRFLKKQKVYEVSPVMVGAGIDTGTLMMKENYAVHAEHVLADVQAFLERTKALADLRAKEGRVLSDVNRSRLMSMVDMMREMMDNMDQLLQEAMPPEKAALMREYVRYQRTLAELVGARP